MPLGLLMTEKTLETTVEVTEEHSPEESLQGMENDLDNTPSPPQKGNAVSQPENGKTRDEKHRDAVRKRMEADREELVRQNFLAAWGQLFTAYKQEEILNGRITGVSVKSLKEEPLVCLQVLLDNNISVNIPFNEIYGAGENVLDMSTVNLKTEAGRRDYLRRQRAFAEKLYDAKTPFIIMGMEPGSDKERPYSDYSIFASRKQALDRISEFYYGGERPAYNVGDVRTAQIVSVGRSALYAYVGGVDVRIPAKEATARPLGPLGLREYFSPGDEVPVYINGVFKTRFDTYGVRASARMAHDLEQREYQESILKKGDHCLGTITDIDLAESGNVIFQIYLDRYDMSAFTGKVPAPNAMGGPLRVGDVVRVEVREFSESGSVYVLIRSVHKRGKPMPW